MRTCPVCKRSWEPEFRVCPIDGVPLQEASAGADPFIGKSIGRCRLVEKIADGDLGPIYKAEDPVRGVAAVQITPPERISSPVLLETFGSAIKLATQLNHPHAVRVYGMETTPDGYTAVFMEYVEGTTLERYRKEHPGISIAEACGLVRQAADGVIAAHRLSMLHGALHPSRILVARDGTVKVAGFHRSGIREGVDVFTATPANLPYLSPEQVGILRDVPTPDYRADVYSLGAILYELLSGRVPYDAKSVQELSVLFEGAPPLPPNFTNAQVSPLLSRVVLKAISKLPLDRHASAEEFSREMDVSSQPAREPQRPSVEPRYEPHYPPPSADSGLFAPPAPSQRKDSVESLWPEAAEAKQKSGEGSFFGWFQTRAGARGSGRRPESRPARSPLDDSSFSGAPPRRRDEDEFEEHTVVVSGSARRSKKRSFSDTFTGLWSRDADMTGTGTGTLPRRRLSSKLYIGLGIGAAVLLAGIITWFILFGTTPTGKLSVESVPPGAQVYVNEEFRGGTPLPPTELKAGTYRVRVRLDGYEPQEQLVDIGKGSDIARSFVLVKQAPILAAPSPLPETPTQQAATPQPPRPAAAPGLRTSPLAGPFNNALRERNLFPPPPDNAWDILQRWQQSEAGAPSQALEQARASFCREVETVGQEKLEQKDFLSVRSLLDQIRRRDLGIPCAANLQATYESAISKSKGDLMASARAAIDRQNYVTPENDNALRYVRLMLSIDPQDADAKAMDGDIFTRAWDQAQAKSSQRQHQEALDICNQLKHYYANPPVGMAAIDQNIARQSRKLELLKALKVPYSVQVRHDHGRKYLILGKRDCTGILRVDGFGIEYQSPGGHPFKVTYEGLQAVKLDRTVVTIQGVGVPDGRIELEQVDKTPNPSLAEVYAKIQELKKLNAEYLK